MARPAPVRRRRLDTRMDLISPWRASCILSAPQPTSSPSAQAVQKVIPEFDIQLTPGTSPRNRPTPHFDITRLREDTGFSPKYDIDSAVAEYIGWLRDHPEESMTGAGERVAAG